MKKTLYILAVLLGSIACSKQFVEPIIEDTPEERPTVTIHFSVDAPETLDTRGAMANTPNIENLWVIEFGASGYYKGWYECEAVYVNTNGTSGAKTSVIDGILVRKLHLTNMLRYLKHE